MAPDSRMAGSSSENASPQASSKKLIWTGRVLSAIPVFLLLLSAVLKILKPPAVMEGIAKYGYAQSVLPTIAGLEILSCVVYLIPRTAVLGAILMTGYLGGATATNVRVGDPSYIMTVLLGVFVWAGLFLRDARLRELLPLRK